MLCQRIYDYPKLDENVSDNYESNSLLQNLWELSSDLHYLFRGSVMTDFLLRVNGRETVYCHKEILRNRSRWFRAQIERAEARGIGQIEMTESKVILDAILFYIYSGNLRYVESLGIPLMDLHEAAKKYGLIPLERVLGRIAEEKKVKEVTKQVNFLWKIKVEDYSTLVAESSVVGNFSLCGTDSWKVKIKPVPDSDVPTNGIYLIRQMKPEAVSTSHVVTLSMTVVDLTGAPQRHFYAQKTVEEDGECFFTEFFPHASVPGVASTLFPGNVLTLSCHLTACARVGYLEKFCIERHHRRYVSNELIELSEAMYRLLKYGKQHHDLKFQISQSHSVSMHHYIFFVRSRIPLTYIQTLEKDARMGSLGWTCFINFLYTGQARYLEGHGRDVYYALCRSTFVEAKNKYSEYLATNLSMENAFDILCDAVKGNDYHLQYAAGIVLAKKSTTITDHNVWIQIAHENTNFVQSFVRRLPTNPVRN